MIVLRVPSESADRSRSFVAIRTPQRFLRVADLMMMGRDFAVKLCRTVLTGVDFRHRERLVVRGLRFFRLRRSGRSAIMAETRAQLADSLQAKIADRARVAAQKDVLPRVQKRHLLVVVVLPFVRRLAAQKTLLVGAKLRSGVDLLAEAVHRQKIHFRQIELDALVSGRVQAVVLFVEQCQNLKRIPSVFYILIFCDSITLFQNIDHQRGTYLEIVPGFLISLRSPSCTHIFATRYIATVRLLKNN